MQSNEILHCSSSTAMVAIIFIISCSILLPMEAKNVGFSTELIHRDSPQSPLYNPNLSHWERLDMAVQRSIKRGRQIGTTSLIPDGGEYLMKMSYGTPAIESLSLVDTASHLSWIQCLPCIHCYPSESPPFNPQLSRTFKTVSCPLSRCLQLNNPKNNSCKPRNNPCHYDITYLDDSHSRGELARDTIIVGSHIHQVTFPNFLFGCGHDNAGLFPHKGAGLVGFGPQEESFISQLRSEHGGKFSHCLAPVTSRPGRISFGVEAAVSGPGVVSTPLIIEDYYYLMLEGISIGSRTIKYFPDHHFSSNNNSSQVNAGGRIVIDSGSTTMFLPDSLHVQIVVAIRKQINLRPTTRLPFTLCYPLSLRDADIPKITFHFEGANVELSPLNTFFEHSHLRCLAMVTNEHLPVYGNLAQTNFLVGYDLVRKTVSFKPIDCTHY